MDAEQLVAALSQHDADATAVTAAFRAKRRRRRSTSTAQRRDLEASRSRPCSPREVRESEAWFTDRHVQYLDGRIVAGPRRISGRPPRRSCTRGDGLSLTGASGC